MSNTALKVPTPEDPYPMRSDEEVKEYLSDPKKTVEAPAARRWRATSDAAVARIPTALPETVDVAVQAGQSAGIIPGGEKGATFGERFNKNAYVTGGFEKVEAHRQDFAQKYKERNPNADDEEINRAVESYTKSASFGAFERQFFPTARRYIKDAGEAIDNYFGAPTDRNKNVGDVLQTIATQAFVPGNIIRGVVQGIAGKGAGIASDLLIPATTKYTPGGIATNLGVGAAVTAGVDVGLNEGEGFKEMVSAGKPEADPIKVAEAAGISIPKTNERIAEEKPEIINAANADKYDSETSEDATKVSRSDIGEYTAVFGALFGMMSSYGRRIMARTAASTNVPQQRGPSGFTNPDLTLPNRLESAVANETAPLRDALLKSGHTPAEANKIIDEQTRYFRSGVHRDIEMINTSGNSQWLPKPTHSMDSVNQLRARLHDSGKLQQYQEALLDETALDSRRMKTKLHLDKYMDATARLATAQNIVANPTRHTPGVVQKAYKDMNDLAQVQREAYDVYHGMVQDVRDIRPSALDRSTQDMITSVNAAKLDPMYLETKQFFRTIAADIRKISENAGLKTHADVMQDAHNHPNYIPLHQDELSMGPRAGQRVTGAQRVWDKALNKFDDLLKDPIEARDKTSKSLIKNMGHSTRELGDDVLVGGQWINRQAAADASKLSADRVRPDMPMNPFDAIIDEMHNTVRMANKMAFKRGIVDKALGGPDPQLKIWRHPGNGQTQFTPAQIQQMVGERKAPSDTNHTMIMRNGMVEIYTVKNAPLKSILDYAPAFSVPLLRETKKAFSFGVTGSGSPGFQGTTNIAMDVLTMNALRPKGSVMGMDIIPHALFPQGGRGVDIAAQVLRVPGYFYADPVQHAVTLFSGVNMAWREMRDAYTMKLQNDLRTNSGFFKTVEGIIGPAKMRTHAAAVAKNMHESITFQMMEGNAITSIAHSKVFDSMKEVDKIIDTLGLPKPVRLAGKIVGAGIGGPLYAFRSMMSGMANSMRMSYAHQQLGLLAFQRGGWQYVTKADYKRVANELRTLSGNFAVKPGGAMMQGLESSVPFMNVTLQGTRRAIEKSISDPYVRYNVIAGALIPAITSYTFMSTSGREFHDYLWNEIPDWKRHTTIFLPTVKSLYQAATTGKWISPRDGGVTEHPMAPEFRAPVNMTITSLRALGIMPFGHGSFSWKEAGSEFAEAFKQLVPLSTIPLLASAQAAAGIKMDLSKIMQGPSAVFQKQNIDDRTMNAASNMEAPLANAITEIFGTMSKSVLEGLNSYATVRAQGEDVITAAVHGVKETAERAFRQKHDVPLVMQTNKQVYMRNQTSERAKELREPFQKIVNDEEKEYVKDPFLGQMQHSIKLEGRLNTGLKWNSKEFTRLMNEVKIIEASRQFSLDDRQTAMNAKLRELNKLNESSIALYHDLETGMVKHYGGMFEQRFGEKLTLRNLQRQIAKQRQLDRQRSGVRPG